MASFGLCASDDEYLVTLPEDPNIPDSTYINATYMDVCQLDCFSHDTLPALLPTYTVLPLMLCHLHDGGEGGGLGACSMVSLMWLTISQFTVDYFKYV